MKLLAFDTSASNASVALWEDERCCAELSCQLGRRHSEELFSMFQYLMQLEGWEQSDIDKMAVGVGPGSFTGLRVGVATAQGLAFALSCPLIGVPSLDALAMNAPAGGAICVPCIDARKQELYAGLYRISDSLPIATKPTRLLKPDALAEELRQYKQPIMMLGSGALQYEALFREVLGEHFLLPAHDGFHSVRASHIAFWAIQHTEHEKSSPEQVMPLYIRPSEAEMLVGPPEGGAPLATRILPDGTILPEKPQTTVE